MPQPICPPCRLSAPVHSGHVARLSFLSRPRPGLASHLPPTPTPVTCKVQSSFHQQLAVLLAVPHSAFGLPTPKSHPTHPPSHFHFPNPPHSCSNDAFDAATGVDLTKRESIVNLSGSPPGLVLLIANTFLLAGLGLFAHLLSGAAAQPVMCLLAVAIVCGYVYQGPPFR